MKLCKDCKWSKTRLWSFIFGSECTAPRSYTNLDTGEFDTCVMQRYPDSEDKITCGTNGDWFEPKDSK